MAKGKKLSLKQKKFVKAYVGNGGNASQAVMEAYDVKSRDSAKAMGFENMSKPHIAQAIEKALTDAGLDLDSTVNILKKATLAGLGERATNSDSIKGVDMMLRLRDAYPAQKTQSAHFRVDLKQNLNKLSFQQLIERHRKTSQEIEAILEP